VGSVTIIIATLAISMVVMLIVSKLPYPWKLRLSPKDETSDGGIDVAEHGSKAYY
jgi:Amt family ammonium transporter